MNEELDIILINGLEFYAYHGASEQEQTVGHRYTADVRLSLDTRQAGRTDQLHDTVSYARVAKRILQVATEEQFRLVEALARRLAEVVLTEFPLVQQIVLRVLKTHPPMNAIAASVGVEIQRTRADFAPSAE